jgi:hypothetical protein
MVIGDTDYLKQRTLEILLSLAPEVLIWVWQKLDYQDVCRATHASLSALLTTEVILHIFSFVSCF